MKPWHPGLYGSIDLDRNGERQPLHALGLSGHGVPSDCSRAVFSCNLRAKQDQEPATTWSCLCHMAVKFALS